MYSRFIERTLQNFLTRVYGPKWSKTECDSLRESPELASRMKYRALNVKWFLIDYALIPLDVLHTMAMAAGGGIQRLEERYARELIERLRSSTPQVILDEFLHEVLTKDHVHDDVRRSFEKTWWRLRGLPVILSYIPSIIGYYLIQEAIGPMIYWPLYIFRKPICWVIRSLRGGI